MKLVKARDNMKYTTCCFIGHRIVKMNEEDILHLKDLIEKLIKDGTVIFLFGSCSQFDTICYNIVRELKYSYPDIKLVNYQTSNEKHFTTKEEAIKYENLLYAVKHERIKFQYFDEVITSKESIAAGKNAYIVRNYEMIKASDICIFYYDNNYLPPRRKQSKNSILDYQPESGTAIAYKYAKQKNKEIINIFN